MAKYNYSQFITKISEIVRDDAEKLSLFEKENYLQEAVKIYSRHRPRKVIEDITGDGNYDYSISQNLSEWIDGFSIIEAIEYPADSRTPNILTEEDYIVYEKEDGKYLRFLNYTPSSDEKIRVTYTTLHQVTVSSNTIPEVDQDALCNLAASLCSGALASIYASTSDPTIGADAVNYRSKSQEYQARAEKQKENYLNHLGMKDQEIPPSSVIGGTSYISIRRRGLTHSY